MMLGKLNIHMEKNEATSLFISLRKINLKQIKNLDVRPEKIKLQEERRIKMLLAMGLHNNFFWITPKAQAVK